MSVNCKTSHFNYRDSLKMSLKLYKWIISLFYYEDQLLLVLNLYKTGVIIKTKKKKNANINGSWF